MKPCRLAAPAIAAACLARAAFAAAPTEVVTGYQAGLTALPLMVMDDERLIEKEARANGIEVAARLIEVGTPSVLNDGLISGRLQFAVVAPGGLAILWAKTRGPDQVKAAAALAEMPSFLLTKDPIVHSLRDYRDGMKIALPAPKVSIQAIYLEMAAAREFGASEFARFDALTMPLPHPEGLIAMLSGQTQVTSHFTSPPFQYQELAEGAGRIRRILSSYEVLGGRSTFTLLAARSRFVAENPRLYMAYVSALEDAMRSIAADKEKYAKLYLRYSGSHESLESVLAMMTDPDIRFGATPLNLMKVVDFMAASGVIAAHPASWRDLTFDNLHGAGGS